MRIFHDYRAIEELLTIAQKVAGRATVRSDAPTDATLDKDALREACVRGWAWVRNEIERDTRAALDNTEQKG